MQKLENPTAFDAIAENYDSEFSETAVGRLQRRLVWNFLLKKFQGKKNLQILELNCGTGEDAIWMTENLGAKIWATDLSEKMVAVSSQKVFQKNLTGKIEVETCGILQAAEKFEGKKFDLVFSNFGGFNCLPPEGIEKFGGQIFQLLRAEGHFVAVVMGKFCWWESLYFFLKFQFQKMSRRWSGRPVAARLDAQTFVETWYFSPPEFQKLIFQKNVASENLKTVAVEPVGFWLPPSYLNPFFEKKTRLLAMLDFLENKIRPSVFSRAADHFLIAFQKTETGFSK